MTVFSFFIKKKSLASFLPLLMAFECIDNLDESKCDSTCCALLASDTGKSSSNLVLFVLVLSQCSKAGIGSKLRKERKNMINE